jgi:hypothetical protein
VRLIWRRTINIRDSGLHIKLDDGKINDCGHDEMRLLVVTPAAKRKAVAHLVDTHGTADFTHFCTRSRKWGSFVIGHKTIKKRMRAKLKAIKRELRKRMHDPVAETGAW